MEITTFEGSQKYGFSQGYLRFLLGKKILKARRIQITKQKYVWLINERSIKKFLKHRQKPGRPKKQ